MSTIKIENGEMIVENGRFVLTSSFQSNIGIVSEADRQHVSVLVHANYGDFKSRPFWGVQIMKMVNAPRVSRDSVAALIKSEIEKTGLYKMQNKDITINSTGAITINKITRI